MTRMTRIAVVDNGPTFSGRAGTDHASNHEDRDARPVRCKEPMQSRSRSARIGDVPYPRRIA